MFEQFINGGAIVREHTDADAGGHHHVSSGKLDGVFHFEHDALRHLAGFFTIVQADQYAELIAPKARNHILVTAGGALDLRGNHFEQFVPRIVAKAVVDAFEVVDIEEHHRQHGVIAGAFNQLFGKQLVKTATVDQVGQRVVMRHLL